jgi:hypothetical protein
VGPQPALVELDSLDAPLSEPLSPAVVVAAVVLSVAAVVLSDALEVELALDVEPDVSSDVVPVPGASRHAPSDASTSLPSLWQQPSASHV